MGVSIVMEATAGFHLSRISGAAGPPRLITRVKQMKFPQTLIITMGAGACALLVGLAQMRNPIPAFIGFGVVGTLILIAQIIYNRAVGRSSSSAPWMRRLRRYQSRVENAGWRIQIIPYDDSS